MSSLLLIRHGQASFGAADYDVLSAQGAEQARALGRHLAAARRGIDAVYAGPRRRQEDTAHHMAGAAAEQGRPLPPAQAAPELDEFPAIEMLRTWLPRLAAEDPALADGLASSDPVARGRAVEATFHAVTRRWARGELAADELETFAAFAARVEAGLRRIMAAEGRGRRVAVVTSGGPIAIAVRSCLGVGDEATLRLAMVIANASITEVRWRDGELTLFGFNHTHHLDHALVTYR